MLQCPIMPKPTRTKPTPTLQPRPDDFQDALASPRVPITPQPWDVLQARYPAALEPVYLATDIAYGEIDSPSANPVHVFDTMDDWRLIVNRERLPDNRVVLHVSLSRTDQWRSFVRMNMGEVLLACARTWQELAQSDRALTFVGFSDAGCPHFLLESVS